MRLNVCNLGDDDWFNYKSDIVFGLGHALQTVGHDTTIAHNRPAADRLNVLVGTDQVPLDRGLADLFTRNLASPAFEYCVFETEVFNGRTLNLRENFDVDLYLELLAGARFVFTPFLSNTRHYGEVGIETRYLTWGHNGGVRIYETSPSDFRFDACFVGTIKGLREQKLAALKRSMGDRLITVDGSVPFQFREYGEINAASILSIDYCAPAYPVNPFRIQRALSNAKIVLHDHEDDADGYTRDCIKTTMECAEIKEILAGRGAGSQRCADRSSLPFEARLRHIFNG
jgi:hypothetical protein